MKPSSSTYLQVRGIKYHCRTWGNEGAPKIFMLHGFQDVSATWQFVVDALEKEWYVIAPDWRGYGLSEWAKCDTYWFPDFIADLDAILEHFEPELPVNIVAHSMGASVAALYAGAVGDRVRKLVNVKASAARRPTRRTRHAAIPNGCGRSCKVKSSARTQTTPISPNA